MSVWDDRPKLTARVQEMWKRNKSFAAIAAELGGGITRNSVCSRIRYMRRNGFDLTRDPLPAKLKAAKPARVQKRRSRAKAVSDAMKPEAIGPIENFPDRMDTCRVIDGDPAQPGWRVCGHPGFPWCEYHSKLFGIITPSQGYNREFARKSGINRCLG